MEKFTHEVLDLHYTEDECQECFAGTYQQCLDFLDTQHPHFMYKIVPIIKKETIELLKWQK